jgi:hypothetical protein
MEKSIAPWCTRRSNVKICYCAYQVARTALLYLLLLSRFSLVTSYQVYVVPSYVVRNKGKNFLMVAVLLIF